MWVAPGETQSTDTVARGAGDVSWGRYRHCPIQRRSSGNEPYTSREVRELRRLDGDAGDGDVDAVDVEIPESEDPRSGVGDANGDDEFAEPKAPVGNCSGKLDKRLFQRGGGHSVSVVLRFIVPGVGCLQVGVARE